MHLSLCMIVRNESRFLPDCLASVRGVVDQMVVVDTGSTDDTREIARAAGALVVEHEWTDDFAAARNAALPWVTGDYILMLDADERLAPGVERELRGAIADGTLLLGLLPLHNATSLDATLEEVLSGAKAQAGAIYLPRVMRFTPDLRWTGRVHESISDWLVRHGSRATTVEAPIIHFGYVSEVWDGRGKVDRNRSLLERLVQEAPHPVAYGHLASERVRAGDAEGARAAAEEGWKVLTAAMAQTEGPRPRVALLAAMRAHLALSAKEYGLVQETIEQARAWSPEHPNYGFLAGQAAAATGDWLRAIDELTSALAQRCERLIDQVLEGATGVPCRVLLARVLTEMGRHSEAVEQWEAILAEAPTHDLAPLHLAALHLEAGRPASALRVLEDRLSSPDAWMLAAKATLAIGDATSARSLALRATEGEWVDPRRRTELGSLLTELSVRTNRFQAGPGPYGLLGALVEGTPSHHAAVVDDAALAVAVEVLVKARNERGLAALRTRRAEDAIPWVRQRMDALLTARGLSWTDDGELDLVFVGGAERSGSTLLADLLAGHPDLWCLPEGLLREVFEHRSGLAHAGAAGLASKDAITWATTASAPPGRRIVDQTTAALLHTEWLGSIFPRARFVHVLRDGHAVAESLTRHPPSRRGAPALAPWGEDLASAATYWASVVEAVRTQAKGVPGRFLEVRYEDLLANPRRSLASVLAFLGERWHDRVLHPKRPSLPTSGQPESPVPIAVGIETGRVQLTAEERAVVAAAAGATLDATGYRGTGNAEG
jgi:tetratricopeptide (TPR) repeat protein